MRLYSNGSQSCNGLKKTAGYKWLQIQRNTPVQDYESPALTIELQARVWSGYVAGLAQGRGFSNPQAGLDRWSRYHAGMKSGQSIDAPAGGFA